MNWGGLVFDPVLAPLTGAALAAWLAIAVAGLAVLALTLGLWRGMKGAWWRALSLALIALALAGPGLERGTTLPLSDIVLLVDDQSASQSLPGRRAQGDAAIAAIEAQLADWPRTEIRRISIGDAPDGTLLGAALTRAIAEEPANRLAGVIVLSDGLAHDGASVPADAPAPVHLLQTGQPGDWDRRIVLTEAPRFALIDEPVNFRFHIADEGAVPETARGPVQLRVSLDGVEINSLAVMPGTQVDLPVTFTAAGANVLLLSLDDAPGELTTLNNRMALSVNAVRDRLRVLLVSGEPNPGGRTWRNLLKSDVNVDLVHFTILRPPEKFDGVPGDELALIRFPTEELFLDRIHDFDLIIFDRYRMRGILLPQYYDNIRRYVEEGGAVLVAAGPEFAGVESIARSYLGEILPGRPSGRLIETPFTPRLTPAGRRHPVTENLPGAPPEDGSAEPGETWGRWLRMIEIFPEAGATVAMIGEGNRPLLMLGRQGEGRVALIASDQLWLWGRGFEGGGPQLELMRRIAHWAMKEPELEEEALDLSAGPGGATLQITRRSLLDANPPALVTGPDGTEITVELGEIRPGYFEGQIPAPVPGLYTVRQGDLSRAIAIGPAFPREFERTVANPAALAELIGASGGVVRPLSDGIPGLRRVEPGRATSGQGVSGPWIGLVERGTETVTGLSRRPLLPPWGWLVLIAGAMLAGWLIEGRRRLSRPE
ncbi:MAG: hypothetical protein Q4G26_10470 [Paracoccus sp. (in: a-proteobacteria)]|nr:hypothetical protein [Paracoccus sp. (in: a-proteobacteria)]